jgi:hypothetical protein
MILPEPQRVLPVHLHPEILRLIMASRVRVLHLHARAFSRLIEGDMLWVREGLTIPRQQPGGDMLRVIYGGDGQEGMVNWPRSIVRPSAHRVPAEGMPLQASRLTLVVQSAAMMRLHQIEADDAVAAGVQMESGGYENPLGFGAVFETAAEAFGRMWDWEHGMDQRHSWACNPEVVQIRFRAIARNVGRLVPALGSGGVR